MNIKLSYRDVAYILNEPIKDCKQKFEAHLSNEQMRELSLKELNSIYGYFNSIDPKYDKKSKIEIHLNQIKNIVKNKEINKVSNVKRGRIGGVCLSICERFIGDDFIRELNDNLKEKKIYFDTLPKKRKSKKSIINDNPIQK